MSLLRAMKPQMSDSIIFQVDQNAPDPTMLDRAAAILNDGGIVVAPTETKYGLLTRADSEETVKRLFEIKGRSTQQATAIFVGSVPLIVHYAELNPIAQRLAALFLPGPLTLVLKGLPGLIAGVTQDGKVGVRISSNPVIQGLLERVEFPLTATSANLSGSHDAELSEAVREDFQDKVELCLLAGKLTGQVSTVVDCSGSNAEILREGAIRKSEIENALREISK